MSDPTDRPTSSDGFLDGNAAAGPLSELFAVDVTAATGQCEGCGRSARLAETRVYLQAPGLVVRCRGCDGVLLRVVSTPGRTWLDMRGLRQLELATP
ncbi:MAG: DUF6510 family protein [Nocardioidaceae bacterium]